MSDDLTMLGPDGIRRSYDEHYDTMMEVKQDPTGAHQAIQRQHDHIEQLAATNEELEAKLEKAENGLFTLSHIHDGNPSDARADILPLDYARHMLWEARSIARTTLAELKGEQDE